MNELERLVERASRNPACIALAEGEDRRVLEAAVRVQADGLSAPILVGDAGKISAGLKDLGANAGRFRIEDPKASGLSKRFIDRYLELRRMKGASEADAQAAIADPMGFAAMLVREGEADGMIGGAVATTAHTVRTALQIVGRAADATIVSSFFLMLLTARQHREKGALVFADCGLVVEPNAEELAQIALSSARSCRALIGADPRVAMLSFSTMGSAIHERVEKVVRATQIVRRAEPQLLIDGEMQFDTAFEPVVNTMKAPNSLTRGQANVFIFPNLEAGNIGYKIAQRIGGATAIGPVLQGLAKPCNDLSRGCSVNDIYAMIAVTTVQYRSLVQGTGCQAHTGC